MSKKSRRRNRKILTTLAALGGAAMLANRRRNNSIAANEAKEAGFGTEKDFKVSDVPAKVHQDAIMRGDAGVKPVKLRFGQVVDRKGNVKRVKPFESAGLTLGGVKTNTSRAQRAANLANKEMSQGKLPPQLRVPGRTNITTKQGDFRRNVKNFFTPQESSKEFGLGMYDMKDGGRVKKRKGAAKRGFGRAYKGGK